MTGLSGKTVFITGGSRGIGKHIALRCARDGANVAIAAKTIEPHPQLEGTIFSAAQEIEAAGGKALPLQMDIRDEEQISQAVAQTVQKFGGIDILVNNASAIQLTGTLDTTMKRFDLMFSVNVRGTFAAIRACLPHLARASNPHVLTIAPPLNMDPKWFKNHCAYTMSKYGMSMCVLGMAEEFRAQGIAFNALWPRTTIATAAAQMLGGEALMKTSRKPQIVADAAYSILTRASQSCTGNFFIDDDVLASEKGANLDDYAVTPGSTLAQDLFI
jgi:citronellol/citronellal dehydrogenase